MEELYTHLGSIKSFVLAGLGQVLANHGLGSESSPLPDTLNKVLLEYSPELTHGHTYVCFHTCFRNCNRDWMGHKAENIYCLSLSRNCLPSPGLGCHDPPPTEHRLLILWDLYTVLHTPPPQQETVAKVSCTMCMFLGKGS